MHTLEDAYVTVAQAATLLHVQRSTIRRWIRQGDVLADAPPRFDRGA